MGRQTALCLKSSRYSAGILTVPASGVPQTSTGPRVDRDVRLRDDKEGFSQKEWGPPRDVGSLRRKPDPGRLKVCGGGPETEGTLEDDKPGTCDVTRNRKKR